ncbi:MAG: methyltransferase domain-containing protein [Streptococcaceae bacterium]|jgi:ubiquinone/menaquinone biosynthesis C-methylase UbiE|nr:methyltransferase domain-containing protein [Streptococcaceae bacterium]
MYRKVKLALKMLWFSLTGNIANKENDYDKASHSYDSIFSKEMGSYSIEVVTLLGISSGMAVLELACGTGHNTVAIAKLLNGKGKLSIVDQSDGMLLKARQKLIDYKDVVHDIYKGDMIDYLATMPSGSVDRVLCAWAICYTLPVKLLKEINRVLKPDGKVGIIETRPDSEKLLMTAFEKVILSNPSLLVKSIENYTFPENKQMLGHWFSKANFQSLNCWEGRKALHCETPKEMISWVIESGAASGYFDALDLTREDEIKALLEKAIKVEIENGGDSILYHTFVAGVASK